VQFNQEVKIDTKVIVPKMRFGINQEHIDRFINKILDVEIEGRKFRTKYQIPMVSGAPQAENFLWTILGNKVSYNIKNTTIITEISRLIMFFQEAKEAGHRFHHYKPTAFHWKKFAEIATEQGVLDHIIDLSCAQAIWQFAGTLAVSKIYKSTYQAKENAAMTLVYINVIRITLLVIMDDNDNKVFSLEFMNKMASIKERVRTSQISYYKVQLRLFCS